MKQELNKARSPRSTAREMARLRARLAEAEATLDAIRNGEVDAVVVAGSGGSRVFTLEGEEHAYRMLIESMNEGALAMSAGMLILFANSCFSGMVREPLSLVIGTPFSRFLSEADQKALIEVLRDSRKEGTKTQVTIHAGDGSLMEAQISVRPLSGNAEGERSIGVIVTDMTDARRSEMLLRALTKRVVIAQEEERGRVALELHDNITQLLCAASFRSQMLLDRLSRADGAARGEAARLCSMIGRTALEVERISANLGPSLISNLGLGALIESARREFRKRTKLRVTLTGVRLVSRMGGDIELAVYRIFQEALVNIEKHARASRVDVAFEQRSGFFRMAVSDDGVGFDTSGLVSMSQRQGGLGTLSMHERANYVGGELTITSTQRKGTRVRLQIPMAP